MSFEISGSPNKSFIQEKHADFTINRVKFEAEFHFIQEKFNLNQSPLLTTPEPPTWPGANSMMSSIGEIMLLLAKVGIALRDQQREQTKIHHDSAVLAMEKSAQYVRDQAIAAFVTAAVSFAASLALSFGSFSFQKSANMKSLKVGQKKNEIEGKSIELERLKHNRTELQHKRTELQHKRTTLGEQKTELKTELKKQQKKT